MREILFNGICNTKYEFRNLEYFSSVIRKLKFKVLTAALVIEWERGARRNARGRLTSTKYNKLYLARRHCWSVKPNVRKKDRQIIREGNYKWERINLWISSGTELNRGLWSAEKEAIIKFIIYLSFVAAAPKTFQQKTNKLLQMLRVNTLTIGFCQPVALD